MELATSLPLGLPDLPEELLEKICRVSSVRFRDPAIDHATPCLFTARPTETDLFSLRMTCKVLHRIATPLAWRRLEIVLTADEHPHSSERPYTDLAFLSSRHELARHIRCLGLQVSWGEKREETREAIERLLEVTTSLRAFHITRASFLTANSARILSSSVELLSIGDTWFLGDYLLDGQNAQLYDFKFSHLKALKMSAFDHRRDLSCYPNIQSLILHFKNPSVTRMTDLSLPWATIRELEIVACSHSVLTDIISELKSHLRTCQKIVLHTLSINTFSMQAPYAKGIIATFKTAKLQKLSFGGLFRDQMDTEFVSFIAETFPELVKVSLMVRGFGIWRDALDDYVSALKRLRHLKVLEWNNVDMPDEYDKQKGSVPLAPPDKNSNELPISYYQQEIKRLASHPSLEVVRHSSWHRFHHRQNGHGFEGLECVIESICCLICKPFKSTSLYCYPDATKIPSKNVKNIQIVYRVLRKISDWALWAFYSEVCIEGEENVPEDGPLILSPTHHNEIIDIATLSATVPYRRMISYWAKSSLFSNPVTRAILLSSGSIPVDRRSKDNQRLFKGTFDSLSIEEAVGIYPEGTSYTEPRIVQVKDGVGWAALEYLKWAKEKNFSMKEVVIVPVGIVYTDKSKYQSRVYVKYGKPIFVANYAEQFLPDVDGERRAAVKRLCHSVEDGMVSLSVNAPNWDILHCSRLARDLLWGDEKNIPLRQFVVVSQTLVDIFSDQNPSPELVNLKSNLLHYYSLLHYSGLTHTSLVGIPLTFSPRPLRVVFSLMQLTALEIFNLPSYAVPLIVHLPSYILASMGARLAKDEEEARAQYKVVFGGLALAVTYPLFGWNAWKLIRSYKAFKDLVPQRGLFSQCIGAAAMAWWLSHWHNRVIESNYNLYKQYKATWKVLLGILSNGLSQSSVQPYTIPPPPPINPFIKRTSSTPDPVRKAPPPVPSRRLIHHLLRARVAAYISCGVFFQGLERSGELVKPADLGETRVDGTGTSVDVDSVTLSSSTVERSGREVVAFLRKNRADFEGLAKAA